MNTATQRTEAGQQPAPRDVLRGSLEGLRSLAAGPEALRDVPDAELIDLLADLRRLRAVTAAVEARTQVAFDASQRAAAMERGVPRRDAGKGVADQIALARGVSAHRAANDLALVRGLADELPATMDLLASGEVCEQAALNVARETVCLMPEDRALVDERIAERLVGMSPRRAASQTRAEAARVDGESVTRRIRSAHADRRVTVRPAPDAMVYFSALLPVKDGVAMFAALNAFADRQKALGDARSRGAIMSDELFARVTGLSRPEDVAVEVQLVMPIAGLFGGTQPGDGAGDGARGEECAWIGEHPIPADIAREIALIGDDNAARWVRRLFSDPRSGEVRAVDERRRLFTGADRRAIVARDRSCRVCGAPIRHVDHVRAHAAGGATTVENGQGLCQRCNLTKELPGWSTTARVIEGQHVTVITTPTGHRYVSKPPPPVAEPPPQADPAPLEERIAPRLPRLGASARSGWCRPDVVRPRRAVFLAASG